MDIFVSGAPPSCTEKRLRECLQPHLNQLDIFVFNCDKFKGKGVALLTVLDKPAALKFISTHGVTFARKQPVKPIKLSNYQLNFKPGNQEPKPLLLRALAKEAADRQISASSQPNPRQPPPASARAAHTFTVQNLQCGIWDYRDDNLVFVPIYQDARLGSLVLGRRNMVIVLNGNSSSVGNVHVRIPYHMVDSIVSGDHRNPSITMALEHPPVFHSLKHGSSLEDMFSQLFLNHQYGPQQRETRDRICNLDIQHEHSAGNCFVYRVFLNDPSKLGDVARFLRTVPGSPGCISWPTSKASPYRDWQQEFKELLHSLANFKEYKFMPWSVKFQIQRLVQNGFLSPRKVFTLLPYIMQLLEEHRPEKVAEGIRIWTHRAPFPGPETDPLTYRTDNIVNVITNATKRFKMSGSVYQLVKKHPHLGMVHKVTVTPSGLSLDGPELETKNRVLRKYPNHIDHFIRVTFADENLEQLHTESGATLDGVYARFGETLNSNIAIADRLFVFLGFSHSSLRSQQCWFMAPFFYEGSLVTAPQVIKDLGDFTRFRSPAKCAARIGQAFSDATETIPIRSEASIRKLPDVERNGRCFTDGVGAISEGLLKRVWRQFTRTRKMHATLLQIRFQGAKGMLMLDSTLPGEQLCLRPSMVKFEGSNDMNLEITGAGFKRLPMYLNRQFIKILEDLGVPTAAFMELQADAVTKLHQLIESPINAAQFLRTNLIATDSNMPYLIEALYDVGLDFRDDPFLSKLVELAALAQLRDIKHRGRIPLDESHTLYGIADTTGILEEGEVHVAIRSPEGNRIVLEGDCLVTRAPALHPGDVQYVRAVHVPKSSPLVNLHNCIVFSTKGDRDLPSQLSGGDLDGDLYNIICERSLWPKALARAADYPRVDPVDIGRPVKTADMTEFFIEFMKTDQLGKICTLHMHMADLRPSGTRDVDCVKLAEGASTAVDFSKTGVPVDWSSLPRLVGGQAKLRPDFMAPSPRLVLDSGDSLSLEDQNDFPEDFDPTSYLEPDIKPMRYYASENTLGHLYRAIDETKFLNDVAATEHSQEEEPLMQTLWWYIKDETRGILWDHHRKLAQDIMESYEETVHDIMHQYSPHRRMPLGELEVFSGTILGRNGGMPSKRTRDKSTDMKENFGRTVTHIIDWILRGDGDKAAFYASDPSDPNASAFEYMQDVDSKGHVRSGTSDQEELPRAIACLAVAMEAEEQDATKRERDRKKVVSFKYVAAAVCLREMSYICRNCKQHGPVYN